MRPSIPDAILRAMLAHRPELQDSIEHIGTAVQERQGRGNADHLQFWEEALAREYLAGETRLAPAELWYLDACRHGRRYSETPDGWVCVAAAAHLLGVGGSRIGQLVHQERLPARPDPGDARLRQVELAAVLALDLQPRRPGPKGKGKP